MEETQKSRSKLTQSGEERCLCTTIPQDLIRSLKILAKEREVRVNYIVIEAIQDLLIKYGDQLNKIFKSQL